MNLSGQPAQNDFTPSDDNLDGEPMTINQNEIQARLILGSAMTSNCNFQTDTDGDTGTENQIHQNQLNQIHDDQNTPRQKVNNFV